MMVDLGVIKAKAQQFIDEEEEAARRYEDLMANVTEPDE